MRRALDAPCDVVHAMQPDATPRNPNTRCGKTNPPRSLRTVRILRNSVSSLGAYHGQSPQSRHHRRRARHAAVPGVHRGAEGDVPAGRPRRADQAGHPDHRRRGDRLRHRGDLHHHPAGRGAAVPRILPAARRRHGQGVPREGLGDPRDRRSSARSASGCTSPSSTRPKGSATRSTRRRSSSATSRSCCCSATTSTSATSKDRCARQLIKVFEQYMLDAVTGVQPTVERHAAPVRHDPRRAGRRRTRASTRPS